MKLIKITILIIAIGAAFTGCKRDLGFTPDGNYLELSIRFPQSGTSESSRLIHSQSDELYISLTYPDGDVEEATFTRDSSDSTLSVLVEDLRVSNNVELYISLGLSEYEIPLSEVTTTINIKAGANTPSLLTLLPIDYTVTGTLTNSSNAILGNHSITLNDSTNITTDSSGHFSLTVSSEDLEDYVKFKIVDTETYELARTNLYLIQNRNNLTLKASPEIYLDFFVRSEQYALPGAQYYIREGGESLIHSGTADSLGRVFYQDSDYTSAISHQIQISYNDFFVSEYIWTPGAPGAFVNDVVMDPYIIYSGYDSNAGSYNLYRINSADSLDEDVINIGNFGIGTYGVRTAVDYLLGKIYLWTSTGSIQYISALDGWSTSITSSNITASLPQNYSSVQQILLLDNGNLALATSYGVVFYNTSTNSVTSTIDNGAASYGLVINGIYQDENGDIYALGSDRLSASPGIQRIYSVNTGSKTLKADLSSYNAFAAYPLSSGYIDESMYSYMLGLYEWDSKIVSILSQDNPYSNTNGEVVFFNPSGSTWSTSGSPLKEESSGDPFLYLRPIGVLPNNKFYFIEKTNGSDRKIFSLNDSDDGTPTLFQYSNPSGTAVDSVYYYYSEPSS